MKILDLIGVAAIAATLASPAAAHVVLDQPMANAGTYYKAVFRVPHGCEGSPTTSISVRIPEGVISVKPQPKQGWSVKTETAPYAKSYENHGKQISEGVVRVTWEGGPLPDDMFDEFALMMKLPDDKETMMLFFPVEQVCEKGSTAWDEFPAPGADPHSLAHPAPSLMLHQGDAHTHQH